MATRPYVVAILHIIVTLILIKQKWQIQWSDINEDDSVAKICSKPTYKYAVDYLLPTKVEDGGLYSMFILPYPSNVMKHIMNANSVIDLIESHKNGIEFDFSNRMNEFLWWLSTLTTERDSSKENDVSGYAQLEKCKYPTS